MNNIYELSQPIPEKNLKVIEMIDDACAKCHINFFIAGAMAREILLTGVHNKENKRRTRDIDIAVYVNHWDDFEMLKQTMIHADALVDQSSEHRLIWNDIEIDIIPFGGIASEDNQIIWPPEFHTIMSVDGFEEAYQYTSTVIMPNSRKIKICSLPGLLLLKLFAWRDRHLETKKDAIDFYNILIEYADIEKKRLYDNIEVLKGESIGWDFSRLGAILAGRDVALILEDSRLDLKSLDVSKLTDDIISQQPLGIDEQSKMIDMLLSDFFSEATNYIESV